MTGQNNLIDLIYPVGSVYLTINDINPSLIFGGTWEKIEDKFLIGAGSKEVTSQGGAEVVYLSKDNIPEHHHLLATQKHTGNYTVPQWALAFNSDSYKVMSTEEDYSQTDFSCGVTGTSINTFGAPFSIMPPYLAVYIWVRQS